MRNHFSIEINNMEDVEHQLRSRGDGFINMSKRNLGDAGASEVSLALQLYPIVILNLEKNNIGFDGCKAYHFFFI